MEKFCKSLLTTQKRMYTPLTFEESSKYIGCSFVRNKTAFDKSVVTVEKVGEDCVVTFVFHKLVVVSTIPSETNECGGTAAPRIKLKVDDSCEGYIPQFGSGILVYNNINTVLGRPEPEGRPVHLYDDGYPPYDITNKSNVFTVIGEYEIGCKTNSGKVGPWRV